MTKRFLLNIPAKDWHLIEAATSGQPTKTKWMVKALREAALKAIPADMVEEDEYGDVAALDAALAHSKQLFRPSPVVQPPPDPKPWLKEGLQADAAEILEKYGRAAMIEWAEEVTPKWNHWNSIIPRSRYHAALAGEKWTRPPVTRDPNGMYRIATAEEIEAWSDERRAEEESKGCILPPRKAVPPPVAAEPDEWA